MPYQLARRDSISLCKRHEHDVGQSTNWEKSNLVPLNVDQSPVDAVIRCKDGEHVSLIRKRDVARSQRQSGHVTTNEDIHNDHSEAGEVLPYGILRCSIVQLRDKNLPPRDCVVVLSKRFVSFQWTSSFRHLFERTTRLTHAGSKPTWG